MDDDAVVASQISAAGIDSYRPSFTRNDLKKRVPGSPVSSSATSQDNPEDDDGKVKQATHSVLENQLVLVVGSLTIVALVLILLIVVLLCRFVCFFNYSPVSLTFLMQFLCRQWRLKRAEKQNIEETKDVPLQPNQSSPELCQTSPAPSSQESETSGTDSYPIHLYGRPSLSLIHI